MSHINQVKRAANPPHKGGGGVVYKNHVAMSLGGNISWAERALAVGDFSS